MTCQHVWCGPSATEASCMHCGMGYKDYETTQKLLDRIADLERRVEWLEMNHGKYKIERTGDAQ